MHLRSPKPVLFCLLAAALTPMPGQAAEILHDHDASPFVGIFGLPDATEGGTVLDAGRSISGFFVQGSSHSIAEETGDELIIQDGETTRFELGYRRGFSGGWELGLELPYLMHESGGLDSVIEDWHDFFGLPNGARDELPRDNLLYRFERPGAATFNFDRNVNGIGDLRLYGGYRLKDEPGYRSAVRFSVKLPTGEAEDLLGSGGVDVSAGLAGDWSGLGESGKWSAFYRLNLIYLGEPEYLSDIYNEFIGQASGGVSWQVAERVGLSVQAQVRSALYDAEVEPLGETSVMLTFGGDIRLSESTSLVLAVGEDIKVDSAPDVSFQLALRYQPR